jgi:hypothetical protein
MEAVDDDWGWARQNRRLRPWIQAPSSDLKNDVKEFKIINHTNKNCTCQLAVFGDQITHRNWFGRADSQVNNQSYYRAISATPGQKKYQKIKKGFLYDYATASCSLH